MKRILILLASIAAFVLPMLAFAPAAQAATGVVTNGTGWTGSLTANGPENRCTLAAVGYDQYGNKRYNTQGLFAKWTPQQAYLNGTEVNFTVDNLFNKNFRPALSGDRAYTKGRDAKISVTRFF